MAMATATPFSSGARFWASGLRLALCAVAGSWRYGTGMERVWNRYGTGMERGARRQLPSLGAQRPFLQAPASGTLDFDLPSARWRGWNGYGTGMERVWNGAQDDMTYTHNGYTHNIHRLRSIIFLGLEFWRRAEAFRGMMTPLGLK